MRRFLLPALVLAVVIAASVLASSANNAANPDSPEVADVADSLGTPIFNVRRVPEWLRQPTTDSTLERAVSAALTNAGEGAATCLSVHRDGASIAEVDSLASFVPGDLHRLVVLAALDEVGGAGFTTEVVRSSADEIVDGVLEGDLWVIGGGDPVLSTAPFVSRFDDDRAATSVEELALLTAVALESEGITTIGGSIIGVDAKYGGTPRTFPEAEWPSSAVNGNEVGGVSSLLINNGFSAFPLDQVDASANSRASNPTAHAASVFRTVLDATSITVNGGSSTGDAPAATARTSLATVESPPLSEIARRAAVDATTAEMLYREVSFRNGSIPNVNVGSAFAIYSAIPKAGYLTEDEIGFVASFDGSGISPLNTSTCGLLTAILDAGPDSLATGALPIVTDSVVAPCAPSGLTELNVLATARDDVNAIAGRAEATNGDIITFAVIANAGSDSGAPSLSSDPCAGLLPAVLDAVASHPDGPTLDTLEPLPAVPAS